MSMVIASRLIDVRVDSGPYLLCRCRHSFVAATAPGAAQQQRRRPPSVTAAVVEPGSTVLVAGATGGVGQLLTAKLLDVSAFNATDPL